MSFEQLMQHAKDIKDKAVDKEGIEQAKINAQSTGGQGIPPPVDYDAIERKYADIEQLFDPFSKLPNPAHYDSMVDDLRAAMGDLSAGQLTADPITSQPFTANPKLDKMTTAGGYLQDWSGEAAMKFKEDFVDTFKSISNNQFVLLATMKGALDAHRAMWASARKDIDDIAHNTKSALDNAGGCGKNQWSFAFSVLSAVVAIGGVCATGGGAAIPLAAVGAAASAGGATVAGINASGDSAETIVNSMRQAIQQLTQHIGEVEAQIEDSVHRITDTVNGHKSLFVAARPQLDGMSDGELTSDRGMGKPG
jgi:hypothetical protein